jgi:hypothetical protein
LNTDYHPHTFPADDYQAGDRFALTIQPDRVYEITGRTDMPGKMVAFHVVVPDWPALEQQEYTLIFPADMPVSARRRVRVYNVPCMLCQATVTTEADSAYSFPHRAICGNH